MLMNLIPYGKQKHLFSFLLGAFLLQFTIGKQWVHQLIGSLVAYAMFLVLPRKLSKHLVPFMIVMYVTLGHLHRQYVNYLGWDLDFTGPHMVLTIKLYSIAWNLWDGHVLKKEHYDPKKDRATAKCEPFALKELPSLLEFLGYTFCFSNVLAGPAFEFKVYQNAANGSLLYDAKGNPKGPIPSQVVATLKPFLVSVVCMGLFVVGSGKFPVFDAMNPQKNTPVFLLLSGPWYMRYGYQWIALLCLRFKYYFAWKNAEGANNIWYAGFEGFKDGEKGEKVPIGWDNASNIDIIGFETAPNPQLMARAWNKKTNNWLTRYIYMRTGGNLIAVYSMSAFWHGFYPGYYFFFLSMPLLTECERIGRKKLSPLFVTSGSKWSPYGILTMLLTSFLVEYFIQPFQMLSGAWGWEAWKQHNFFGHIICVAFYALCMILPTPKKEEQAAKEKKQ
jgi:hypothetical protein